MRKLYRRRTDFGTVPPNAGSVARLTLIVHENPEVFREAMNRAA